MADWVITVSDVWDSQYDTELRGEIMSTVDKGEPDPPLPRVGQRYELVLVEQEDSA